MSQTAIRAGAGALAVLVGVAVAGGTLLAQPPLCSLVGGACPPADLTRVVSGLLAGVVLAGVGVHFLRQAGYLPRGPTDR